MSLLVISGFNEAKDVPDLNNFNIEEPVLDVNVIENNGQGPRRDDPIELNDCQVIDEEGEYFLSEDIDTDELICFDIQASNVVLDCQDNLIEGDLDNLEEDNLKVGIKLFSREEEPITNIVVRNCRLTQWQRAIDFTNVENSMFENLNLNSNSLEGINFVDVMNSQITESRFENNGREAISLLRSSNNEITNNNMENNEDGIKIEESNGNFIVNNEILNSDVGIYVQSSSDNEIFQNVISNIYRDIYVSAESDEHCNNFIDEITREDGRQILYFNEQVELNNLDDVSEVIFCNADNSRINGLTINNGEEKNNGLIIIRTDNSIFSDINVENTLKGIYLYESNSNTITDSSFTNNEKDGMTIERNSNSNSINNNVIENNEENGIHVRSDNNIIQNNFIDNNEDSGIEMDRRSDNNIIRNNHINNNDGGFYLELSQSNSIEDNILYDNGWSGIYFEDDSDFNNVVNNVFCYHNYDIFIEDSNDNEFLYNQFDTIEGLELEGMPCNIEEQEIELRQGWNLISSYLVPYYADIEAIFGKLARDNKIIIVKDEQGRFYRPDNDFNNIPEWNPQKAYQIKVSEPVTLTIKGEDHVNPRIELHQGWNYIAYPLTEEREMNDIIENVLSHLVENNVLNILKNGQGNFYLPRNNFNNIERMIPGQGYMIKINRDAVVDFGEIEEQEYDLTFSATENRIIVNAENRNNDLIESVLFYYDNIFERIMLGKEDDEHLVVENGFIITNEDLDEQELRGMEGITFLYDIEDESRIIRIRDIDTLNNKTDFYDETTDTLWADQEFLSGEDTSFEFLPNPFRLRFYHDPNPNPDSITFSHITDEDDGISKIKTIEGAKITLSEENPQIIIEDMNNDEGSITIDLQYSNRNEEINVGNVEVEGNNEWLNNTRLRIQRAFGTDFVKVRFPER